MKTGVMGVTGDVSDEKIEAVGEHMDEDEGNEGTEICIAESFAEELLLIACIRIT